MHEMTYKNVPRSLAKERLFYHDVRISFKLVNHSIKNINESLFESFYNSFEET